MIKTGMRFEDLEFRGKTFDIETVFARARSETAKRKQTRKLRGPDSPLYTSICPLVYIIRVFGLAPYEFSQNDLVPSNTYLIFTLFILLFYSSIAYMVYLKFNGVIRDRPILGGTENAKVFLNFFVAYYETLYAIWKRKEFTKIWNVLQDFDESTRLLGYSRKEIKTMTYALILLISNILTWTSVNQMGMHAFMEEWRYNVGYMLIYIGTSVSVYKFVGITFLLGQRFQFLNSIAISNLPSSSGFKTTNSIGIETIQDLYNELLGAGEKLISLYHWSLLIWLGNLSMHCVSNMYFMTDWIFDLWKDWAIAIPLIACLGCWLIAFLSQVLLIHIACDFTSKQASRLIIILFNWQVRLSKRTTHHSISDNMLHMLSRRLNFTAGGCFSVNLTLLRSTAAILSTYLVILLQFPD